MPDEENKECCGCKTIDPLGEIFRIKREGIDYAFCEMCVGSGFWLCVIGRVNIEIGDAIGVMLWLANNLSKQINENKCRCPNA